MGIQNILHAPMRLTEENQMGAMYIMHALHNVMPTVWDCKQLEIPEPMSLFFYIRVHHMSSVVSGELAVYMQRRIVPMPWASAQDKTQIHYSVQVSCAI
ncbi:UNVERIFIED_CONTAM: hypothetical protein FKN15_040021 [Acipenser sinensis]